MIQVAGESAVPRPLALIGVPTSAGAFAPGQEQAPAALRAAGLVESLRESGLSVHDRGDRATWRWRPDRDNRRAQNLDMVVEIVRETAGRVADAVSAGEATLVVGGDCTVGIGAVAGHVSAGDRLGLVYLDSHADLNVPGSVHEGALDWMGMAHMLGIEGAAPALTQAGSRTPLLQAEQVVVLGWGPEQSTPFERAAIDHMGLKVIPVDEVADDPEGAAVQALGHLAGRCDRVLVHFDVDVIDFTDVPLSENWGRNEGLSYAATMRAVRALLASPLLAGLAITELNPDHVEEGGDTLKRFVGDICAGLSGAPALAHT